MKTRFLIFFAVLVIHPLGFTDILFSEVDSRTIFFHQFQAPFLKGLEKNDLLENSGIRLLNTGFDRQSFSERWLCNEVLEQASASGTYFYMDRISGGMPFQSLEGIGKISEKLHSNPYFLGYSVHEWAHAVMRDHQRIKELTGKSSDLTETDLIKYEGRVEPPFFSSGDGSIYAQLYKPLTRIDDAEGYLSDYFSKMNDLTGGQLLAVSGYFQFSCLSLDLGAKNVMVEIGNQVPLTALQIACIRGACQKHEKPFGVYYEPWGGNPLGCLCHTDHSPWVGNKKISDSLLGNYPVGPEYGSSRLLQKRLLVYAWLSGATYFAEEWDYENYFADFDNYKLTEYGRIFKQLQKIALHYGIPRPFVKIALMMPEGRKGIDIKYLSGKSEKVYGTFEPSDFDKALRHFCTYVLNVPPITGGSENYNLTNSPAIGLFNVLPSDTDKKKLSDYDTIIYFDKSQKKFFSEIGTARLYTMDRGISEDILKKARDLLPFHYTGKAGVTVSEIDHHYLVGIFNNEGVVKREGQLFVDPGNVQKVALLNRKKGDFEGAEALLGEDYVTAKNKDRIELEIPAGRVTVLKIQKNF